MPTIQREDVVQRIADSYVSWQENSFPGLLGNVVAGRISKQLRPGRHQLRRGCRLRQFAQRPAPGRRWSLRPASRDMVVTGGIDTFNDIFMYMCFSKTPALSPTGDVQAIRRRG